MVGLPLACGPGGASEPSGPISAGNIADVQEGALVLVGGNALLVRDAGGLYAMSAVCTHAGCVVNTPASTASTIVCGCHGSRFSRDGSVVNGPASRPLQHYQVDVATDGTITIQGDQPVASDVRTAAG